MTTRDNQEVSVPSGKNEDSKKASFFDRPRAGGKSAWDWLDLLAKLAVPLMLGLATLLLSIQQTNLADLQHQSDQQQSLNQQQATILQTYMDTIQDLLLNHHLLQSKPGDDVAILARARTLTALQGLDSHRKGTLLEFLYEARLIGFYDPASGKTIDPTISLFGVNLSGVALGAPTLAPSGLCNNDGCFEGHLSGADLHGIDLSYANLTSADLSGTDLSYANLTSADLSGARLGGADLFNTKLFRANLREVNLSGAWLEGTDLGRTGMTQRQLDQADLCKGAFLDGGLICHHQ